MRLNQINANLHLISLIFSGMGRAHFGSAARLGALMINDFCAPLSEQNGINFTAKSSANDLIIELSGALDADYLALIHAAQNTPPKPTKEQILRIKAQLQSEKTDYHLQSARGFSRLLLGLKYDEQTPSSKQMQEFFARLQTSWLRIVASLGQSDLQLRASEPGWLRFCGDFGVAGAADDTHDFGVASAVMDFMLFERSASLPKRFLPHAKLINELLDVERTGICELKLTLARDDFCKHERASCTQTFAHFGANLGKFSLNERALAAISSTAFGAGFSSRITELIRVQNALAYSAFAQISYVNDHAYWLGFLQTKTSNENLAKKLISEQFTLLKEGLNDLEFSQAKAYLLNSSALEYRDFASIHALALARECANKSPDFNQELLRQISQASLDDVNAFLDRYARNASFFLLSDHE